jgi:hypothetical protein
VLAGQPEQDATGDQQPGARAAEQDPLDPVGRLGHVLEVVQDQQGDAVAQVRRHDLGRWQAVRVGQAERLDHLQPDPGRVGHGGQRDEPHPVRVGTGRGPARLQGEPGLAGATRAGEGEQPHAGVGEHPVQLGQLGDPPDERGGRGGQVGGRGQRPRWREHLVAVRAGELVEPLGPVEVLQPVMAEVVQHRHAGLGAHGGQGGGRDQHLAAVGGRADPGGPVQVHPDVVVVGDRRRAGVDPHPHPQDDPARPLGPGQAALGLGRGPQRRGGGRERDEAGVALGAELDPAVGAGRCPQDRPVPREEAGVVVAEGPDQPGRAFDIGEQQRHRAGRQLGHHHTPRRAAVARHPPIIRRVAPGRPGDRISRGCAGAGGW